MEDLATDPAYYESVGIATAGYGVTLAEALAMTRLERHAFLRAAERIEGARKQWAKDHPD